MKTFFQILFLFCSLIVSAQENPVKWQFSSKKIADKTYEIHATATIDEGWHIYAQSMQKGDIALPTTVSFSKNPLVLFNGKVKEIGTLIKKREEILELDLKYHAVKVDFVQVIKLKTNVKTVVIGKVEYMACTDERCLPPANENFRITLQ